MVKIIANGAEFDVSGAVRQDIYELLKSDENEKNVVFIVPDQFEFETEKLVYKDLLERNLLTRYNEIHIETFSSLSEKILANAGEKLIPADDTIKNILMHKAVREQKDLLTSLSRQAEKAGFCRKMLTTISMLNAAGLSASRLDESSIRKNIEQNSQLNSHRPFVEKLCDVSKIQASYEGLMSRYLDRVDAIGKAADFIASEKNHLFENADVFVDCFNDFTGNQLNFLLKLSEKANNITFGFTVILNENSRDTLFFSLKNQIDKIIEYARENQNEPVVESDIPRRIPENSPLSELSEKIFSNEKSSVSLGEACELVHAADAYDEIDYTAAKIKELCLDKGYLYRDIAVLCADSSYAKLIKRAFDRYEIPYFIDIPEPILYQPLVNFFLALLNVLRDFSVDSVLSLIKTNFMSKPQKADNDDKTAAEYKSVSLSKKDIDDFETYVFEWNLQAKHLKKPFNYAMSESVTQQNAEAVRAAVVEPILKLKNELKNKDGSEITRLIYNFAVNDAKIERAIRGRCFKPNSAEPDTELLRLNQQLWNTLAVILETLERELQGENISLDEYFRIFSDICSGTSLAKPPQFQDSVIVGDIDRTRANGIKSTFILGASYDRFPAINEGAGVFSENETEFLIENISEFGITNTNCFALKSNKEQYCLSLYRAYRALSLATERLTIISSDYDIKGANVQKSLVVNDILNIFPDTEFIEASDCGDAFYCRSIKAAKQRYVSKLAKQSNDSDTLKDALEILDCSEFVKKLDDIQHKKSRRMLTNPDEIGHHELKPQTAKRLFDTNVGATSVEKLSLCKFNYFCESGLKIREKTQRVFDVINRGNVVHYILQNVLETYCDKMDEFFGLTRKDFTSLAKYYLDKYLKEQTNGDFEDDFRTKFLFSNLAVTAVDVLITLQAEFASRKYRPKFFELDLSKPQQMSIIDSNDNAHIEPPKTELYSDEPAEDYSPENTAPAKTTNNVLNVQPLAITLDDGSTVSIHGRVDRVDLFITPNNKDSYVRIVDYKSSAKSFDTEKAKKGINIQMLLYLFAICDANKSNTLKVHPGGISYLPSANSSAVDDKMSAFRLLAMNHCQSGLYVSNEVTDEESQSYFDALFKKIFDDEAANNNTLDEKTKQILEKMLKPSQENTPSDEEFEKLREDCTALLKQNFSQLFNGEIDALPIQYTDCKISFDGKSNNDKKIPCKYCRFKLICGNSEERVIVVQNAKKGKK